MPLPSTATEFFDLIRKSELVDEQCLGAYVEAAATRSAEALPCARALVQDGLLTRFQARMLLEGKWHGFRIGKYKVLDRIGAGGAGNVFLCEHAVLRHRVAVKVLRNADDPMLIERFYGEARAGAALQHPNIVRTYDIDRHKGLHYLVLEYIDGTSLRKIVTDFGALEVLRAIHYIRQAAQGLQHAHEAGLVHRDVNPGNLLLDRHGTVKILDMGLARFLHEDAAPAKNVLLGTADYLAPEQALDSHRTDCRADLYSLGASFYDLLTGRPPFAEANTIAKKLLCHQIQQPRPIRQLRPEVPEGLVAIVERMMARDRDARYRTAAEVVEALAPWSVIPIPPPPAREMPQTNRPAGAGVPAVASAKTAARLPNPASGDTAMLCLNGGVDTIVSSPPAPARDVLPTNDGPGAPAKAEPSVRPAVIRPRLIVVRGRKPNAEYPLREGTNVVGRFGKDPVEIDLSVQEAPGAQRVARRHAVITLEAGKLAVEDLNSGQGTFVNWSRLAAGLKHFLKPGDVVQVANIQLKVAF